MRTYVLTEEQFEVCLAALAAAEVDALHALRYADNDADREEFQRSADNYGRVHGELLPLLNVDAMAAEGTYVDVNMLKRGGGA